MDDERVRRSGIGLQKSYAGGVRLLELRHLGNRGNRECHKSRSEQGNTRTKMLVCGTSVVAVNGESFQRGHRLHDICCDVDRYVDDRFQRKREDNIRCIYGVVHHDYRYVRIWIYDGRDRPHSQEIGTVDISRSDRFAVPDGHDNAVEGISVRIQSDRGILTSDVGNGDSEDIDWRNEDGEFRELDSSRVHFDDLSVDRVIRFSCIATDRAA